MQRTRGFTLVELVLVMIVISVGLLGMTSLFSGNITALTANEGSQQAAQYAQECAERVVAVRRDLGFTSTTIASTMCDTFTLPTGFSRTVSVPATYTGTSSTACPSGATCRNVTVTVSNGSMNSAITIMLVN